MYKVNKILVPLDGSDNSFRALDTAIFFAKKCDAKIVCLYSVVIIPITEAQMVAPVQFQIEEEKYARKVLEKAKNLAKQNDIEFSQVINFGNAGYNIIRYAKNKTNKIDLIVIGSRGRGAIKEIFLGSTSNYVLHKSHIPVTVVK
ncbi:MAG: universal stress protein [Thaumarchaeota archaeon]|nr:universal stress protein [Nitrososphaerota archaeon]